MNARSALNKVQPLEDLLLLYEPDIVAITETWLSPNVLDHEFASPSYAVIRKDRPSRGGGVALLIRRSISYSLMPHVPDTEAVFCKIMCNGSSMVIGCVYRSPSCDPECLVALHDFLHQHARRSAVMLMGDFNLAYINWTNMHHTSPMQFRGFNRFDVNFQPPPSCFLPDAYLRNSYQYIRSGPHKYPFKPWQHSRWCRGRYIRPQSANLPYNTWSWITVPIDSNACRRLQQSRWC